MRQFCQEDVAEISKPSLIDPSSAPPTSAILLLISVTTHLFRVTVPKLHRPMQITPWVSDEVLDLLSSLADQDLSDEDLTPTLAFLSALVAVLSGVIAIDGIVAPEEEAQLQILVNSFIPPEQKANQLIQKILYGVEHQQIYLQPDKLSLLVDGLSLSQKVMVMGLAYEMAGADGMVDGKEKLYLRAIANRLGVLPDHLQVLEIGFTREGQQDPDLLQEVADLLSPKSFRTLEPVFEDIARSILVALPSDPTEVEIIESADPVSDIPVEP